MGVVRKKEIFEMREYHTRSSGIFFKVERFLYREKSPYQLIEVIENRDFGRILFLDGLIQTTERDEFFYHEMLIHPAFVTHPKPENILVIGGGDGGALKEVLRYPIERSFLVEIDSAVIEACKNLFPWLSSCLKDKRTRLIIEDGREFLEREEEKFDLIFVDSSDPVGPSLSLHNEVFFELVKKRLKPDGIAVAQIGSPLYQLDSIAKKIIFLKGLFKETWLYFSPVPTYPGGNWCFVFISENISPFRVRREPPSGLKYYNLEIHRGVFSLPSFIKEKIPS